MALILWGWRIREARNIDEATEEMSKMDIADATWRTRRRIISQETKREKIRRDVSRRAY